MDRWRKLTYSELLGRIRQFGFLIAGLVLSAAGTYEAVTELTAPAGQFDLARFLASLALAGVLPYGVLLSAFGLGPTKGSNGNGKKDP